MRHVALGAAFALAACSPPAPETKPSGSGGANTRARPEPTVAATVAPSPTPSVMKRPAVRDAALIRAEWAKAENRASCAPIGFTDVGRGKGIARRATFSSGWAVAYDQPDLRSAYGVAGPGLLPSMDRAPVTDQRIRLRNQWPYLIEPQQLPQPAFAGYGIEGAKPYPADNPDGNGMKSLAYLRVGGQTCTYNVWSHLGRAHLELLLRHLAVIETD